MAASNNSMSPQQVQQISAGFGKERSSLADRQTAMDDAIDAIDSDLESSEEEEAEEIVRQIVEARNLDAFAQVGPVPDQAAAAELDGEVERVLRDAAAA